MGNMLTQPQIDSVWQSKMDAEIRSCYFGEIANREGKIKQWIGGTFILSSAAGVALLAKMPAWVAVTCSLLVAAANGYQIAVGQDSKIRTTAKLHLGWLRLDHDYDRLWSHVHDDDAEERLDRCREQERDLSETAATEVSHDPKRFQKWVDFVHKKHENPVHEHEQTATATSPK